MTGFNLPPGCNEGDIPGNGPEDAAWERLIDWLYDCGLDPGQIKAILVEELGGE